jgi:ESS family glutamate:Na+ symporter
MTLSFDATQTLALAIAVLFVGSAVIARVPLLRNNDIPIPVVGGILIAIVSALFHGVGDVELVFDTALRGPLMLAFFTTIGLGADLRQLRSGGPQLALFGAICVGYLVFQNTIGVIAARSMDLHPLVGLLSSSITLSGGHGTGAAYAERFSDVQNIAGSMELAMACATFGLVIGGLIGGPVAGRLIRRHTLRSTAEVGAGDEDATVEKEQLEGAEESAQPDLAQALLEAPMTGATLLRALFLVLVCVIGGELLGRAFEGASFTLPAFVWSLLIGVVIRNSRSFAPSLALNRQTVEAIGSLSLGLFLAMALMSIQLWKLSGLAGPLVVMLTAQTLGMMAFATFITFRLMGSNYDGAVMAGGHCGFGMGATPTAIANIEAMTQRHGPSPQAFLLVPLMGAFFIDFANAIVIQGFLALPLFGL